MLIRSLVVGLLCAAGAHGARAEEGMPPDVARYIQRREACDHWRGETGDDSVRKAQILRGQCQFCPGSDARLARLKAKHKANQRVQARLGGYDPQIEPAAAKERAAVCKAGHRGRGSS